MTVDAQYELGAHPAAKRELEAIPEETRNRLIDRLEAMAEHRDPTTVSAVEPLVGYDGLLRVAIRRQRAVVAFDKPRLQLVLVDHRDGIYNRISVAERRRSE